MKTRNMLRILFLVPVLLAWFGSSAHAFYDASVGRWFNRDPINELGFNLLIQNQNPFNLDEEKNLYGFARNNPVVFYDADGRVVPIIIGGGIAITTAQAVAATFGLSLAACLASPPCAQAVRDAIANLLSKCRPRPRDREKENCPLEDEHNMGPAGGYRCEYWCRKSGTKPVIYVPYAEGGCPKYYTP